MYSINKIFQKDLRFSKGATYILISTILFTAMQSIIKTMPQYNSFQHVSARSIIGWIMAVSVLKYNGISLEGINSRLLIIRALIGSASMFSFFYILTTIPYGTASSFKYMSPIFASIFAALLLGEKVNMRQWFYFILCFAGILLLKGFDVRIGNFDLLIGLICGLSGGLLIIVIKKIGEDDHPLVILHYFMLVSFILSSIIAYPNWVWPDLLNLIKLILIGVIGFFAQYYFTKSIQEPEEVSELSILRYLEVLFALIVGYFFFNEKYTTYSFMAITLIMTGIILSFLDKRFKSLKN